MNDDIERLEAALAAVEKMRTEFEKMSDELAAARQTALDDAQEIVGLERKLAAAINALKTIVVVAKDGIEGKPSGIELYYYSFAAAKLAEI